MTPWDPAARAARRRGRSGSRGVGIRCIAVRRRRVPLNFPGRRRRRAPDRLSLPYHVKLRDELHDALQQDFSGNCHCGPY